MVTASMKRIIWGIGWYLVWILNDFIIFLTKQNIGNIFYQFFMLFVWVIPLFFFKDDKIGKKK